MTIGDDEFFGSTAARNPLTLDELKSLGRQQLNIAFTLYWRDDLALLQETNVLVHLGRREGKNKEMPIEHSC
jgi:hypothetical protein